MRERKYVKLRVDMFDDTKFKIIDTFDERDLIHYIWTRFITLAGKVNLEGNLYMSKNIPYTAETLSIEFNRSVEKVKVALNVLKDLEMIELTEDHVYRVKNFAKHQNIKVEEKIENIDNKEELNNKEEINNKESIINEGSQNQIYEEENIEYVNELNKYVKIIELKNGEIENVSLVNKNIDIKEKLDIDLNLNSPILLDDKKNKKRKQSGKKDGKHNNDIQEINECTVEDSVWGDVVERKGDEVIMSFSF